MNITDAYVDEYPSLTLNCLDAEWRAKTVGYWYTVTSRSNANTAFRTREELLDWAEDLGLQFAAEVPGPDPAAATHMQIAGLYRRALHRDVQAFLTLDNVVAYRPVVDNAGYTVGKVTADPDGHRTIHLLNVNYRDGVFPLDRYADQQSVADYIANHLVNQA